MCGIVGIYSAAVPAGGEAEAATLVARLAHRGPDARRVSRTGDSRCVLAHARLAIIDPQARSDQPFVAGSATVAFNGEIYNYRDLRAELERSGQRFDTGGDTEVIARGWLAWGDAVFSRLQGMYAIALHDGATGELHLARDVFGIKPLAVLQRGGELRFASEAKALRLDHAFAIDEPILMDLLSFGYHHEHRSWLEGVDFLPPGRVWTYAAQSGALLRRERVAKDPDALATADAAGSAGPEALRRALSSAVDRHLVADVPVAVALSGGIDSSAVSAFAAARGRLTAYTSTYRPEGDPEVEHAALVARHLGLAHRVVRPAQPWMDGALAAAAWHLEEPVPNIAMLTSLAVAKAVAQDGVKVLLLGEGADELLGGYPWHLLARQERDPRRLFAAYRARRSFAPSLAPLLTDDGRAALARREAEQERLFVERVASARRAGLEAFLAYDRAFQLGYSQLLRVDRMYMSQGVEARVPFLDDEVLRVSGAIAERGKITGSRARAWLLPRREKIALAQAMRGLLPRRVLSRPKFAAGGTANLHETAHELVARGFERACRDPALSTARATLSRWLRWDRLATAAPAKVRLLVALLAHAADRFVVGVAREDAA